MNLDALKVHEISDGQQLRVSLLNYGARISGLNFAGHELALAYANISDYLHDPYYLGATIGPITNRVANAQLTIDQTAYNLPANEGKHCLHSGGCGFDKALWTLIETTDSSAHYKLEFDLSKIGMRGKLTTRALYCVDDGALTIDYISECDTQTYINLTNHMYLNLSGHASGDVKAIDDHEFRVCAESFVNVDKESIPVGDTTPLDAPLVYRLGSSSDFPEFDDLVDHHFNSDSHKKMSAKSLTTGIGLSVLSNSPGFQFYTGKFLAAPFKPSSGFCVETQLAPDAINQANFYSPILKPGESRRQTTSYDFSL